MTSRYLTFTREEWKELRAATPLTLREPDLEALRGINVRISLDEVADVYLPLTRLLNLYVSAAQNLAKVSSTFLGTLAPKVPYVIGVAGSVAVGKSTFARILQALLSRWPDHPQVDLVTTDGFLLPNSVLDARGVAAPGSRASRPRASGLHGNTAIRWSRHSGSISRSSSRYIRLTWFCMLANSVQPRSRDV
jgi:type I pantothenate kinase